MAEEGIRHLSAHGHAPCPIRARAPWPPAVLSLASPGGAQGAFTVEANQRLSRSILWQAQRRYFHEQGIEAWRTAAVPHYVTNNPALAGAYAEVVIGFLRDCRTAGPGAEGRAWEPLDEREPIHIVELGAGSGRFGYLFLKALLDIHARSPVKGVRFRYVMTDFTETNLAFLRAHDALRPLVERGILDFALFDAEQGSELRLVHAGETLSAGSLQNPLVVLANYVLDGISQDAFSFAGGRIHECLVTLRSPRREADLSDPAMFERLVPTYTRRPISAAYYEEPELDAILHDYARDMDGATILFPSTALRCLRRLSDLSRGRLLLLSGDKGNAREEALRDAGDPRMSVHGSFSLMVNYHAIGAYVRRRGGQALGVTQRCAHLSISAFLLGAHPRGYEETRFAFEQSIDRAGPDDFFCLRRGVQESYAELDLEHLVSLLRLSRDDPKILRDCLPALRGKLEGASEPMRRDLREAALRAWENYYHIGEEPDLAFACGLLLFELGACAEALSLFERSRRLYGDDAATWWNIGMCHHGLGRVEEATRCIAEASALDPAFRPVSPPQVEGGGKPGSGDPG
jgi:tetratricopeptide (TPR) repeat protein